MNGIKVLFFCIAALAASLMVSCLEENKFVEDVFVYEPYGEHIDISRLKEFPADAIITDEVYVQGTVTSSDANGNFSRQLVIQDNSGAVVVNIDMGASNEVYPLGKKVSVQARGMMLADIGGVLQLAGGINGEGIRKEVRTLSNRETRNMVFPVGDGETITPAAITLSQLNAAAGSYESQLVTLQNVFFQTTLLPFANAGGSSEQFRTLYDSEGKSALLLTKDASTMAGEMLPKGKGTVTGVLTYPNGTPQVMVNSLDAISFSPGETGVDDPEDRLSHVFISEYYASGGQYYIEIFNSGTETVTLSDFELAADTESNGVFGKKMTLDAAQLAPGGIVLYKNDAANVVTWWADTQPADWDPLRVNCSPIRLDGLSLDGNSQVALYREGKIADILATTNKYNWASGKTLIRRTNIDGHSKASDFTRADAGWATKIAGYHYNLGSHRYYDTDPETDVPQPLVPRTILEVRGMEQGTVGENIIITGRVTSDRSGGNVASHALFMQDGSNRGICVEFREGQNHTFNPGDEVGIEIFGTELVSDNGLLVIRNAAAARSRLTGEPNVMPEPIEASVAQIQSLQSMYIYIKDVQVNETQAGNTYGSGLIASEDLFDNKFFLSTLPTASFAGNTVSQNSGIIKGIASVSEDKLLLMPTGNADLDGLTESHFRPITATPITVAELRKMPAGAVTANVRVTGTVVSDFTGGNYMSETVIFVQDADAGFLLELPATNTYAFGQSVIVVLSGATISTTTGFKVTPMDAASVVAVGAPDPAWEPTPITQPNQISENLYKLVKISKIEVAEEDRLKKFNGEISFRVKGLMNKDIKVNTNSTAEWLDAYIPTASGEIIGLLMQNGATLELWPRRTSDLAGLPTDGKRNDNELVSYFVPSTDASADLFISETVISQLSATGTVLAPARNNCNSKFIEMFNPTGADLNLNNYRVACIKYNNSVSRGTIYYWQFPEGLLLKPGKTLVFKYISSAQGTSNTSKMTNTIWPAGFTGDQSQTSGVVVYENAVPGVILIGDARDYKLTIANSVASFPSFDGNDILVVQKTTDGGTTWTEIDRLYSLRTKTGVIGGGVQYDYLNTYRRKPGVLGTPGNVTDVQSEDYTKTATGVSGTRGVNDFESIKCDPETAEANGGGGSNWIKQPHSTFDDLGVHQFSIKPAQP